MTTQHQPTPPAAHHEALPGGNATRVTFGKPSTQAPQSPPPSAPQSGTLTHTHGGAVQRQEYARHQHGGERPAINGSVASTAKNVYGQPAHRIDDQSTVRLPGGMRTTAVVAAKMGHLQRQADGSYVDMPTRQPDPSTSTAQQAPQQEPEQTQEQGGEDGPVAAEYDDGEIAELHGLLGGLRQDQVNGLSRLAVDPVVTGDAQGWERLAASLQRTGKSPQQAADIIQAGYSAYETSVATACAPVLGSIEPAERMAFYSWAQSNARDELRDAVTRLVHQNRVDGFTRLARRYAQTRG